MLHLKDIFDKSKIFVCCGPGGVGKTTLSAALGIAAASTGLHTLVLTIDPAKRLATSMGLKEISHQAKVVPNHIFPQLKIKGKLEAMMLDTKSTFDALIERYAPDEKTKKSILQNPLYQHLSTMVAGSVEYMAMEKLYEIAHQGTYDLIILDTPPSRHALEFFEAPERMNRLLGDSFAKILLKPGLMVGKSSLKFFSRGSERVMGFMNKIIGWEFLQDLSVLFLTTAGLLDGFAGRATEVANILKDGQTNFMIISTAQTLAIHETYFLLDKLDTLQLKPAALIVNRFHEELGFEEKHLVEDFLNQEKLGKQSKELLGFYQKLSNHDTLQLKSLTSKLPHHLNPICIPQYESDIHGPESLARLAKLLLQE